MAIKAANDNSMSNITALPSGVSAKSMILLATETASSSSTISFTSGIDSTYKEYVFRFYDIHPSADGEEFTFQADTGTNTSYNQTITSTYFLSEKPEADSGGSISYQDSRDLAQSTSFQHFGVDTGNDNDHASSGFLHIFDPSSTTFVKHFMGTLQQAHQNDLSLVGYVAGYWNTTTALTRVQFKMSSGTIDAGTIKLYGVV
jgi:hypothetical protein